MELAFSPGVPPARPGPLSRFLPPMERGVVRRFLASQPLPGGWLLDPFGTSPDLAIEAALRRGAVAAFSNPVVRFILEMSLDPPSAGDFGSALASLASAPKDGGRLEGFLLDLYRSECAACGASVIVDDFIWDRERRVPILKLYACPACHHVGDDDATPADQERAVRSPGYALAHAMAAERTAPADGPDRESVEAALAVYPARAVYALITVLQKLDQLALGHNQRRAAEGLLLSAADAANGLWGYPETRARPKQLIASPRYREVNLWRAIERAVAEWRFDDPAVELAAWPAAGPPTPGVLAVFPGPIRDLDATLPGEVPVLLTALPRPNQAFWTLSALWASWLWGRAAAEPIRLALRRRRYDWTWHAAALRGAFRALAKRQPEGSQAAVFLPEAEHGFVAAALAGLEAGGYRLRGHALRLTDGQGLLTWEATRHRGPRTEEDLKTLMGAAAERALLEQGEPAAYGLLHAAATIDLARGQRLAGLWESDEAPPLSTLTEVMEAILAPGGRFVHLEPGAEAESGRYWLVEAGAAAEPLSDRVEHLVLAGLRRAPAALQEDVERETCEALRGLQTPDRRLLAACLESYAEQTDDGRWALRPEDLAEARAADQDDIRSSLAELGRRLGCQVEVDDDVRWTSPSGSWRFRIQESARLGGVHGAWPSDTIVVLPGGRGSLVAEKIRRDPRLRAWLASGGIIIKFRHVRRLATDRSLTLETLPTRLEIDPPEHEDPQLPLL